jgi:hypothetical protein
LLPNQRPTKPKKPGTTQPADSNGGGKRKTNGKEQQGQKNPKKGFSDRSLKMGLFHVKKGTPALKALPNKSTLKNGVSICINFCCHEKKCNFNHLLCKNGKNYTN